MGVGRNGLDAGKRMVSGVDKAWARVSNREMKRRGVVLDDVEQPKELSGLPSWLYVRSQFRALPLFSPHVSPMGDGRSHVPNIGSDPAANTPQCPSCSDEGTVCCMMGQDPDAAAQACVVRCALCVVCIYIYAIAV